MPWRKFLTPLPDDPGKRDEAIKMLAKGFITILHKNGATYQDLMALINYALGYVISLLHQENQTKQKGEDNVEPQ